MDHDHDKMYTPAELDARVKDGTESSKASSLMCALPQEVVDVIINMTDTHTKTLLYDSKGLHDLVSKTMFKNIEQDIFAAFKVQHTELLQPCLNCLQHHVWSDGTPMKNRSRHCYKTVKGRTRIRAE